MFEIQFFITDCVVNTSTTRIEFGNNTPGNEATDIAMVTDSSGEIIMFPGKDVAQFMNTKIDLKNPTIISSSLDIIGPSTLTGSLIISSSTSESLSIQGSGSTIIDVQGSQGQLFSVTDDLLDIVFEASDISGDPLLTVSGSGLVDIPVGPLHVTGSIGIASPSSSGHFSYTPPLSKAYSFTYNADNADFYNDGYISLGWDNGAGNDPELTILTDPSSDKVQAIVSDPESLTATTFDLLVVNGVTDIYSTGMGQDQRLDVFISAGSDSTYPMYKLLWFRSNTTSGGNVSVIVERFNS